MTVDAWELERGGISYSVETAARFRELFPQLSYFGLLVQIIRHSCRLGAGLKNCPNG